MKRAVPSATRHENRTGDAVRRGVDPAPAAFGDEGAAALSETTLLMAITAWPCSRPPEAVLAAYASDPALGAMRVDFTDLVRRTAQVTASGLLARREPADTATS